MTTQLFIRKGALERVWKHTQKGPLSFTLEAFTSLPTGVDQAQWVAVEIREVEEDKS